jgi:hypothetical protein
MLEFHLLELDFSLENSQLDFFLISPIFKWQNKCICFTEMAGFSIKGHSIVSEMR